MRPLKTSFLNSLSFQGQYINFMAEKKYLTVLVLLETGVWLKYRNIVEGHEGSLFAHVARKFGPCKYANLYDKHTKKYLKRVYC